MSPASSLYVYFNNTDGIFEHLLKSSLAFSGLNSSNLKYYPWWGPIQSHSTFFEINLFSTTAFPVHHVTIFCFQVFLFFSFKTRNTYSHISHFQNSSAMLQECGSPNSKKKNQSYNIAANSGHDFKKEKNTYAFVSLMVWA